MGALGGSSGAKPGQGGWHEGDEGTARDHMQLCTKPAWKSARSQCVGSFGLALGHPKAQPQGLLPTGVGCSWAAEQTLLLEPQNCSWGAVLDCGL